MANKERERERGDQAPSRIERDLIPIYSAQSAETVSPTRIDIRQSALVPTNSTTDNNNIAIATPPYPSPALFRHERQDTLLFFRHDGQDAIFSEPLDCNA